MNPSHRFRVGHITECFNLHVSDPDKGIKRETDHIHLFTYRALRSLLSKYNFEIMNTYGGRTKTKGVLKTKVAKIIDAIEGIIHYFPSLSPSNNCREKGEVNG